MKGKWYFRISALLIDFAFRETTSLIYLCAENKFDAQT